jgi:hypothetical protein
MFRKRGFRPRGRGFGPAPHPMLQRANELMAIEDYPGAARAFEELAQRSGARAGPAAPHLYMQAGKARILAGQVETGMVHIKQALALFAASGEWLRFCRNRRRAIDELDRLGLEEEARVLAAYLSDEIPAEVEEPLDLSDQIGKPRANLPIQCMGCGAPLRSDEVDWVDENSAECTYCGTIARTQP